MYPQPTIVAVDVPHPAKYCLVVFISATSVQLVPSNVSTFAGGGLGDPPATIAAVCVPAAAKLCLQSFKSPISVQLLPL